MENVSRNINCIRRKNSRLKVRNNNSGKCIRLQIVRSTITRRYMMLVTLFRKIVETILPLTVEEVINRIKERNAGRSAVYMY